MTHKQEANLGVKESTLEKVQCQLRDSLQTLTKKRKEVDRLREELARCENKCSEHEIRIGANRLVIDRLNEQIEAQAKAMEKMRIGETQPKTTVVESKTRREETIQPESASPTRNGRNQFTLDRELARKSRPTTVTTNRGKNVDFRLDDNEEEEELLVDSNYRATTRTTSLHDLLEEERHLKNHLFAHTKERPQLKEVNFRTNQKTKGVGTNSANVMTMTFGGRRF